MGFVRKLSGGFTGSTAAKAATKSAEQQMAAGEQAKRDLAASTRRAQEFYSPFAGIAERGLAGLDAAEGTQFLADPNAQFDFLQNNPLFQLALDNANRQTQQSAAARGRLSAGDTAERLAGNVLLSASPLLDRQRQDIMQQRQNAMGLLNFGQGIAGQQANVELGLGNNQAGLTTDIGAALAAGTVGRANADSQLFGNVLHLASTAKEAAQQAATGGQA